MSAYLSSWQWWLLVVALCLAPAATDSWLLQAQDLEESSVTATVSSEDNGDVPAASLSGSGSAPDSPGPRTGPTPRSPSAPAASYPLDVLNPLRYLDRMFDGVVSYINSSASEQLRSAEGVVISDSGHAVQQATIEAAQILFRYRVRWEEANNVDLMKNRYDRTIRARESLRLGGRFEVSTEFVLETEVHNVRTTFSDDQEDLWDFYRLSVLFTGFEGEKAVISISPLKVYLQARLLVGRTPLTFLRGRLFATDDWMALPQVYDTALLSLQETDSGGSLTAWIARPVKYIKRFWNDGIWNTYVIGVALIGLDPFDQIQDIAGAERRALLRHSSAQEDYDRNWFPINDSQEEKLSLGMDFYWLFHLYNDLLGRSENGATTGREETHNFGWHGGIDWGGVLFTEGEANYQVGRRAGDLIEAWAAHSEFSFKIDWYVNFSLSGEVDIASGDRSKTDGKQNQFFDYYPVRQGRFGYHNIHFAWSNLLHYAGLARMQIGNTAGFYGGVHFYRALVREDATYGADGLLIPAGASSSNDIGFAFEGRFLYYYSPRIVLSVGYAQFHPGTRFEDVGQTGTHTFIYLQAELRGIGSRQ